MDSNKTTIIYNKMLQDIHNGVYKPNERIVENNLAVKFKTSRNTVRNVLSLLEKDNLVKIERHKGARIVSLDLQDIINLYELRAVVEGYIFKKAVPNMTEEDISAMEQTYRLMEKRVELDNFDNHPNLNLDFHEAVYKRCENSRSIDIVRDIKSQVASYNFKTILIPGRKEQNLEEHKNILKAVKLKDGELAETRLKEHIHQILETIIRYSDILN